eukprot:TRINITY_DN1699_c0_g1_i1.p1 TRINITY_DN1699_c0_g1~~TRINITY_DN1699_c0_g1_i1.p1  ORF type:complete len:391 (-),score=50.34 TRINITY_DN1699_c0_g1_i1:72-1244(-)
MGCCSWFPVLHWDSILSYSTVKIVQIRDKRLGILHYLFMLLIIGYIVGFTVLYQKRYLHLATPVGSVRVSLQSPQTKGLLPPPPEDIPYCLTGNHTSYNGFETFQCLYWDENLAVYPIVEQTAMFVTTRVTISEQNLEPTGCEMSDNHCHYVVNGTAIDYFIASIEKFTLLIDHSMYVDVLGIQANSQDLPGELLNSDGDEMHNLPINNTVGVKGHADILDLSVVLQAAGLNTFDGPSNANRELSTRDNGLVVLIFITYSNTYTFDTNNIRYQYTVKIVDDTKFKAQQSIYTKTQEEIVVWNRHGLRIIFLQVGELGKFDFQVLLLTFVAGLGLLAVSTFIVDFLAIRILPSTKKLYKQFKYLETPEYNETRGTYEHIPAPEEEPINLSK